MVYGRLFIPGMSTGTKYKYYIVDKWGTNRSFYKANTYADDRN